MPARKRLEWSPRAGSDLLAIENFYADFSQITADRVMAEIRRSALRLETYIEFDPDVSLEVRDEGGGMRARQKRYHAFIP